MTIMGGIAEFERNLILKRCEEGIQRAKRKGTKFGRPTALDPSQRRRIAERYTAGETMAELAREYGCGEATVCLCRDRQEMAHAHGQQPEDTRGNLDQLPGAANS